jgi:hypothetical protein
MPIEDEDNPVNEDDYESLEELKLAYKEKSLYFIIFDPEEHPEVGISLSSVELKWDLLASTPPATRSSGSLGVIKEEKEEDEGSIVVRIPDWLIDLPKKTPLSVLYAEARKVMKKPDYAFDEVAIANYVEECERAMRKLVERYGGTIDERDARKKLTISAYRAVKEREKSYQGAKESRLEAAKPPVLVQLPLQDDDPPVF